MRRRFFVSAVPLFICAARPPMAGAADWWGSRLPNPPADFIFGYGSLIDTASRDSTAGYAVTAIPARVSAAFGYIRAWNDRSPSGFTALGLRRPQPGESASTINGVIFPAQSDMTEYDSREAGYVRIEVPLEDIEPVSWQPLPAHGHIWTYVPVRPGHLPGENLPEPTPAFPMLQSYIDIVLQGALEYGPVFARELIETTADWSRYWLNDRDLARRPWVHDPQYAAVDALLASTPPAASVFSDRLFAEPFAARWLMTGSPNAIGKAPAPPQ